MLFRSFGILSWFKFPIKQQIFISWVGLRGAASIVFAIFAMTGDAVLQYDIFHIIFIVALISVSLQGTLLPTMAGISGLPNRRFQFFNWLSGLLWVSVVTSFGYALSMIPFVKRHEDQVMTFLMILPIALLTAGLLGTLFVVIKKKYCNA